jgi:hypothetical protein
MSEIQLFSYIDVLSKLDLHTKLWAESLTATDLSYILQSVYRVPGLIASLKNNNSFTESQIAADIGKAGELQFARICRSLPDNYKIINTAKQGKQGDFIIEYKHKTQISKCLVDIKKYTTTVPKKELDKFYEDLTFGSYDAGLIISYTSKFTGVTDNICLEERDLSYGRIPIMYLANVDDSLILQAIKILMLKTVVHNEQEVNMNKIESMFSFINQGLSQSALTRRMLSELNSNMSKSIQKCQENLLTLEVQIKRTIKEMGKVVDESLEESKDEIIFTEIKPEEKLVSRDDNLQEDISLTVQELKEPSSVQISDCLEKFKDKDRIVINMIASLKWNGSIFEPENNLLVFYMNNPNITLKFKALKTKTSVTLSIISAITTIPSGFVLKKTVDGNRVYTGYVSEDLLEYLALVIEELYN